MATTITIELPEGMEERIIDAVCKGGHWTPPMDREVFFRQEVARMISERVVLVEQMAAQAALNAGLPSPPPIAVSGG